MGVRGTGGCVARRCVCCNILLLGIVVTLTVTRLTRHSCHAGIVSWVGEIEGQLLLAFSNIRDSRTRSLLAPTVIRGSPNFVFTRILFLGDVLVFMDEDIAV